MEPVFPPPPPAGFVEGRPWFFGRAKRGSETRGNPRGRTGETGNTPLFVLGKRRYHESLGIGPAAGHGLVLTGIGNHGHLPNSLTAT